MRVIKADVLGMCFGVRDALQVLAEVDRPEQVTIHGELVHNETVLVQLQSRGFQMVGEHQRDRLPATAPSTGTCIPTSSPATRHSVRRSASPTSSQARSCGRVTTPRTPPRP